MGHPTEIVEQRLSVARVQICQALCVCCVRRRRCKYFLFYCSDFAQTIKPVIVDFQSHQIDLHDDGEKTDANVS